MQSDARTGSSTDTPHPRANRVNVLVYAGPGTSQSCLLHLKSALASLLSDRYDVQGITAESLVKDPWTDNCALLAFPGGRDLGFLSSLGEAGCRRIADWVRYSGGRYLGLCAGAYFASDRIEFESGRQGFEVVGPRPLKFFPGACKGTAFPGFVYDSEQGARDAAIHLVGEVWTNAWTGGPAPDKVDVYYNGGGFFDDIADDEHVTVIARYAELESRDPAGVLCRVGDSGKAVLWGVHPEHPATITSTPRDSRALSAFDEGRTGILRATLRLLDLEVPDAAKALPVVTPMLLIAVDPADAQNLALDIVASFSGPPDQPLKDVNNSFRLHSQAEIDRVFSAASLKSNQSSTDSSLDVVVCGDATPPSSITPIFDAAAFHTALKEARKALTFRFRPSFGSEIFYGEVVTSTQTVLDKNPRLLAALPSGFAFVGSHQIAGRGRGSNNWLSPPGCLQFSLVLKVERSLGPLLVFAQYLFGLAVVDAVRSLRGYEDLELRLKWPNDLYADLGEDRGGLRKIGGILVNTTFAGGNFTVIIGCGINTTNSTPTTSLLDLIRSHNERTGSPLPVISQEHLLGRILPQFEHYWTSFERERSFATFAPMYTRRWLHQDKEVRIEETGQSVRILGLNPENGYLRTILLDNDSPIPSYVDLQPDGNSFDMMQGLLKVKR